MVTFLDGFAVLLCAFVWSIFAVLAGAGIGLQSERVKKLAEGGDPDAVFLSNARVFIAYWAVGSVAFIVGGTVFITVCWVLGSVAQYVF